MSEKGEGGGSEGRVSSAHLLVSGDEGKGKLFSTTFDFSCIVESVVLVEYVSLFRPWGLRSFVGQG